MGFQGGGSDGKGAGLRDGNRHLDGIGMGMGLRLVSPIQRQTIHVESEFLLSHLSLSCAIVQR